MRKTYLKTIAILGVFFLLAVGTVRAQSGSTIEANIPFDFNAGAARMKAGKYTVKRVSWNTVMLRSADGKSTMILAPLTAERKRADAPERLVFHRYGNQFFLSEVWTNRAAGGSQLFPSKAESQLAKQLKPDDGPQRIEITARTR